MNKVITVELEYDGKPYIGEAFETPGSQEDMVCSKCPTRNTTLCGSNLLKNRETKRVWDCSQFGRRENPNIAIYYSIRPDDQPRLIKPKVVQSPEEIDIINQIL